MFFLGLAPLVEQIIEHVLASNTTPRKNRAQSEITLVALLPSSRVFLRRDLPLVREGIATGYRPRNDRGFGGFFLHEPKLRDGNILHDTMPR